MKKLIACVLIMSISFALFVPAFAANGDELERLILKSKELFSITDEYSEFNSSINSLNGKQMYRLSWSSKESQKSVSVSIGSDGIVTEYYAYEPDVRSTGKTLPTFDREASKKIVSDFLAKVAPDIAGELELTETPESRIYYNNTDFYFVQQKNGVNFPTNNVRISSNAEGAKVVSFNRNWTLGLQYPNPEKAIDKDKAISSFKENMGLKLVYSPYYDKDYSLEGTILSYQPKDGLYEYYIDAFTGEKKQQSISVYYERYSLNGMGEKSALTEAAAPQPTLSPVEKDAVEEINGIITFSEAEKIARDNKYLNIDDSLKLENYSLLKYHGKIYHWSLSFTDSDKTRYISVQVNGVTKELVSYNNYSDIDYKPDAEKYDAKDYKDKVNTVLEELFPEKFKQLDLNIDFTNYKSDTTVNYSYSRLVNNIPVNFNGINVTYNPKTEKLVSFSVNWNDFDFPTDETISLDKIYDILFKNAKYEMIYLPEYKTESSEDASVTTSDVKIMPPVYQRVSKVQLGYMMEMPFIIDAVSGELKNSNGQEYKIEKPLSYSDIDGHWSESYIKKLAEMNIGPDADVFSPDENISQEDFLRFLYCYDNSNYNADVEELTRSLRYSGILEKDETLTKTPITREESILYVIRALKYDKVAQIQKIFTCDFKDLDDINTELIGHVCIGNGLGILKGTGEGYFNPKSLLSRAQGAVILYNMFEIR